MSDEKTPEQLAAEEAAAKAKAEKQPKKITLKGVVLNGTDSQKEDVHTLHLGNDTIVFKDGKAQVTADMAKRLVKDGYAEEGE